MSQSTVSRALRGDPRVAPATQTLIADAAKRLNYIPNAAARSLITSRTQTVGVVVSNIANPFYPQLVDILHDELDLGGYRMVLLNERAEGRRGGRRRPAVAGPRRRRADLRVGDPGFRCGRVVHHSRCPVVLLNRDIDGAEVDRVVSDNRMGGELGAELLHRLGHRRIGLVAGPANASTSRDRANALHRSARAAGHAARSEPHAVAGSSATSAAISGAATCSRCRTRRPRSSAATTSSPSGSLDAAKRLGVDVPGELSVLGYDDIEMASWEAFNLSTMSQPLAQMAKAAARMLVSRLESPSPLEPRSQVFPAGIVTRASTGPPNR